MKNKKGKLSKCRCKAAVFPSFRSASSFDRGVEIDTPCRDCSTNDNSCALLSKDASFLRLGTIGATFLPAQEPEDATAATFLLPGYVVISAACICWQCGILPRKIRPTAAPVQGDLHSAGGRPDDHAGCAPATGSSAIGVVCIRLWVRLERRWLTAVAAGWRQRQFIRAREPAPGFLARVVLGNDMRLVRLDGAIRYHLRNRRRLVGSQRLRWGYPLLYQENRATLLLFITDLRCDPVRGTSVSRQFT